MNSVDKNQMQERKVDFSRITTIGKYSIECSLKGCSSCPHPDECDGINRLCHIWFHQSGR